MLTNVADQMNWQELFTLKPEVKRPLQESIMLTQANTFISDNQLYCVIKKKKKIQV